MEAHRPQQAHSGPPRPPLVSVLMASFRAARHIRQALASVLGQSHRQLEVIVVDDGSDDDTPAIVKAIAASDPRVKLLHSAGRRGPAHARNLALNAASGDWLAVVDADDVVHPRRVERLLAAAGQLQADIVFDDLLQFREDGSPVEFLLRGQGGDPWQLSAADWIRAGSRPDLPALGYLKPLIRASALGGRRYDETLRIGEDYELVLRLLLDEASAWIVPEPLYFYRRHAGSVSRHLFEADYRALIASENRVVEQLRAGRSPVYLVLSEHLKRLQAGLRLELLVVAIKRRQPLPALRLVAAHPSLLLRLGRALLSGRRRRRRVPVTVPDGASERSLLRLHLASAAKLPAPVDGAEIIRLPAATPASHSPGLHRVWADIAGRTLGRQVEVSWDDEAGRYAAGFILGRVVPATGSPASSPRLAEAGAQ